MKILKRILIGFLIITLFILLILFINDKVNQKVHVKRYTFTHENIPDSFNDCKLMVISDLHEADFSEQIISHIKNEKPDAIMMLGDMVQLPEHGIDRTIEIAEAASDMGIPVYAVSGNHDRQCGYYEEIIDVLWAKDVYLLENGSVKFEKNGESIFLVGIKDPKHDVVTEQKLDVIRGNIEYELSKKDDEFTIFLNHRADLYPYVKDTGVDLILSGHLHGGVLRLPFVGGIFGQDGHGSLYFPDYEYGVFKEENYATMIVSGGCDKNPKKRRYFNPPEILMITLRGEICDN